MSVETINTSKFLRAQKKLWEYAALQASDIIEASGWKHSATKKPFSQQEMDEMVDNVYIKLKDRLSKNSDILEIGCGSGLVMRKIAPYVKKYDATDISDIILDKCRYYIEPVLQESGTERNYYRAYAHEIDTIPQEGGGYDIIILNSVLHRFPDHDYARNVIVKSRDLLKRNSCLFCGDIIDRKQHDELLLYNRQEHDKMLSYPRSFFENVANEAGYKNCRISNKLYTIENELTLFRYDAILHM